MSTPPLARLVSAVLTVAALGGASASASASAFHPADRYDCYAYQAITGGEAYVVSYRFESGHRYAQGIKAAHGKGLARTLSKGRYKRSGARIVGLSGALRHDYAYLAIQRNDLAPVKRGGGFASLGCYDAAAKTPATPAPATGPGAFPVGTYACYRTYQQTNGSYGFLFAGQLEFWSDGTYMGSIRQDGWNQQGTTINFTGGSLWSTSTHDVGTWYPAGVTIPHAEVSPTPGQLYTLVVRSTQPNEVNPPMTEFTGSTPSSFNYCKQS